MTFEPLFPIIDGRYKMEKEPLVRIGVILTEDAKNEVVFSVPTERYVILSEKGITGLILSPRQVYTVRMADGVLSISDQSGHVALATAQVVRLVPPIYSKPLLPGDGVLVREIVAGRGFHWQKRIDQTLSDVLEFSLFNNHIVMVNELPLERYLTGVITGEMSGECPIEFMKAQAIAARSWLLGQPRPPHRGQPFLWCNDDCCQRYQGTGGWSQRAIDAIAQCRGQVLITKSDRYCDARYSKSTGGVSEDARSTWDDDIEGLVARLDAPPESEARRFFPVTQDNIEEYILGDWVRRTDIYSSPNIVPEETIKKYLGRVDEVGQYFRWEKVLSQEELREALTTRADLTDLGEVLDLVPGRRGRSGRLTDLEVVYRDDSGATKRHRIHREYNIRAGLSAKFLYSGCFLVFPDRDTNGVLKSVTLKGAGWGHGSGLCQIGGLGRAIKGQTSEQILLHYYTDVRLEQIYL